MSRKHGRRRHHTANAISWAVALELSQPFSEEEATRLENDTRAALVLMLEGAAEQKHYMRLAMDINVAGVRAEQIGNSEAIAQILEAAAEALAEATGIKERHGRYGLTGPGRQRLADGVEAFVVILRASSPRQMDAAEKEVCRRLQAADKNVKRPTQAARAIEGVNR